MVAGLTKITISAEHVVPWERSRISAQLIRESQLATEYFGIPSLTTEEADEIALAVEDAISQIAPPVLTAPMVREFVNVELIRRGHIGIRAITTRVGMSVADAIEIDRGFGFEAKENANLQENAETGHKKKADKISKEQYLLLLPPHLSNRHLLGDYHIHDLEYFGTRPFCQSWDLRYFFYYGLMPDGTGTKASVAGPAMNAEVAILHAVKVLASAQTNWAGGQGLMDFLTFISPYLEGLGYKEIKQLMQMLVYELTQAYVARGGQLCFTSVQLTPGVPKLWRDRPCVYRGRLWDGKHQAERRVYGEFEREVRLAFEAVMEVMIAGDFWGKPFSFPKPEISIAPEFIDEEAIDSPLYDGDVKIAPSYRELYTLAFTLAATQGTPYFDNTVPPFRQTGGIECYQSIPGDTLVATKSSDGVKLKAIEKVLSGDVLLTPKGFETFESMLKYKTDRNILQLTLANGRGIQCTPEHEMPVIRGGEDLRLRASDIREGDRLKISTWLPNDGGLPRHEKANEEGNDVELAYLMGLYVAEGYMLVRDRPKGGRIQFSFGEENLANRCKVLLENLFGATVKLQHLENEYRVMVYNLALCKYFQDVLHLPKKTGSEGRIPDHIFAARDELKWAFLLGYIQGDGCLRETHKGNGFWRLSIETASKELAEGFVLLTSSLGYNFSIREKASRPGMMSLTLTRQKELKKFLALQPGGFDGALRVKAIQPRHYQGMVYDPVEVQNHDFVLGNGIVSGNCCAFTFQVLDSKESFEDKMNFVGGAHFSPGGNQVITLNTVRYAMLAHGDVQAFEDVVKQALEDVGEVFQIKKKWLDVQISNGRIPFMTQRPKDPARVRGTGMGITLDGAAPPAIDREEQVYAIGLVGINETVQALTGEELHESREAWKMGVFIVARIAKMVQDLGERLGLPIVLARTPAETVAQRFAVADLQHQDKSVRDQARKIVKGDVDRALELIAEGKTDLPVYQTNGAMISNQAMNGAEAVSLFKKAEIEGVFFPLFAGGDIFHIFLKEANPSPAGLMDFAFKLATNTNIGYFTFTRDMTVCKHCSKVASGLKLECPFCGSDKVEWLSRVTGYIQSVSSFNEAKKQELKDRTRYGEEEL
jgi:anaerobic ribonucleoside-triphosphate reductase/intein/homing endonuclease